MKEPTVWKEKLKIRSQAKESRDTLRQMWWGTNGGLSLKNYHGHSSNPIISLTGVTLIKNCISGRKTTWPSVFLEKVKNYGNWESHLDCIQWKRFFAKEFLTKRLGMGNRSPKTTNVNQSHQSLNSLTHPENIKVKS